MFIAKTKAVAPSIRSCRLGRAASGHATKVLTAVLAIAGALAWGGCAGSGSPRADSPSIAGRWASVCVPSGDGRSNRLAFDIDDRAWSLDYDVFADSACADAFLTVHIDGPYELGSASSIVAQAYEARFGFTHKTITPRSEAAAGYLSSPAGCGAPFTRGVARDVLVEGCANLGQYPASRCSSDYDVVSLEDGALQFGARPADNDMCTPDKRPRALSGLALQAR